MSGQALGWAKRQGLKGASLNLMLLLADSHNDAHGFAWPTIGTLVDFSGLTSRHVKRVLKAFVDDRVLLGFDVIDRRSGRQRACAYWFPIEAPEPTLKMIASYELEVGGLLLRREAHGGEGDSHVTLPQGDSRVTPEGDSRVTGRVTRESPLNSTYLNQPKELLQGARAIVDEIWPIWPEAGRKASSERECVNAVAAELAEGGEALRLIGAAKIYAADKASWGSSGRPLAPHRFFGLGRWVNFATAAAGPVTGELFPEERKVTAGDPVPADLRATFVAEFGEGAATSWFPIGWRTGERVLIARTGTGRDWLRREARAWLTRHSLKVISAAEAAAIGSVAAE